MERKLALSLLADPTRSTIMERLARGPASVIELAGMLPVSRPAVSQHLKLLKEAKLVAVRAEGARRVYSIDPEGLGQVRQWLDGLWGEALSSFKREEGK